MAHVHALSGGEKTTIEPRVRSEAPPRSGWAGVRAHFPKRPFAPIDQYLARRSKLEVFIIFLLVTLLVGVCEFLDRWRLSMVLLHIVPISMAAWYGGARVAFPLNVASIPVWYAAIHFKGDDRDITAFALNRFLLFAVLILVVMRLKALTDNLEALARVRAQALLNESAERERLEREMLDISEREQRRIGQELHDGLCQQLTGTAMLGQAHARKLTEASEKENARKIVDLLEQTIFLARGVAKGLYPVETHREGLMQAFEEFSSTTSDLFKVQCRFECDLPVMVDDPTLAGHLFRIAQEAVSNAIKHGRASEIQICLSDTEAGLLLSVSDNGRGIADLDAVPAGMGLRTMAIRSKLIGGHFTLKAIATGGVEVQCLVPEQADA